MNVKIKATGIACLLGEDYGRVYTALTRQFGKDSENLFSERIPGHEYLQWVLPGDGWTALSQGDPIMSEQVRIELRKRREHVISRFGANVDMANRVLTVPDDEYIYYKADANGAIDIKLTAWGYRYPERVDGGNASGAVDHQSETENITIKLTSNGKPVGGKEFKINGYKRKTDANGLLPLGNIPVGHEFDIEIQGILTRHCRATVGECVIELDCTQYAVVEISVKRGPEYVSGAEAIVSYEGAETWVPTDGSGRACARVPLSASGALCTVEVDGVKQQQSLREGVNNFDFSLPEVLPPVDEPPVADEPVVSPPVPPVVEEPAVEEPIDEEEPHEEEEKNEEVEIPPVTNEEDEPENEPEAEIEPEPEPSDPVAVKSGLWSLILLVLALVILTLLTFYLGKEILF